jgi:hypothetical protein
MLEQCLLHHQYIACVTPLLGIVMSVVTYLRVILLLMLLDMGAGSACIDWLVSPVRSCARLLWEVSDPQHDMIQWSVSMCAGIVVDPLCCC